MSRAVLVTGATGFLGQHVCRALAVAGWDVRAGMRRSSRLMPEGVTPVELGDLEGAVALDHAVRGVKAVVHLAARAHVLREGARDPETAFDAVNVDATRRLAEAAAAAQADTFLFMSSIAAIADRSEQPVAEDATPRPTGPYGRSKLAAEGLLAGLAGRHGMRVCIIRPPLVYGPGMRGNPHRLCVAVARGWPLPLAAIRNRRSLLYVENLAAAVAYLLGVGTAPGLTRYHIADPEPLSTPEFARRLGHALGRPARLWPIPPPLLYAAAALADWAAPLVRVGLTRAHVTGLAASLVLDTTRLAATGFHRPWALDEALRRTASWYLESVSS